MLTPNKIVSITNLHHGQKVRYGTKYLLNDLITAMLPTIQNQKILSLLATSCRFLKIGKYHPG
ncbi:MAG: hypothetical protein ISR56_03750 [Bacteroidales bacterium]|nr:hypothetical protein [Bacteroidales bacterium]